MLTQLFLPVCLASQTVEARSDVGLEYTASTEIYVHQNETASAYITVHNKASENQAFVRHPSTIRSGLPKSNGHVFHHQRLGRFHQRNRLDAGVHRAPVKPVFWR